MERSPSLPGLSVWPPCSHGAPASWQVWGVSSGEHTTGLCGYSSWSQRGPSVQWPTTGCLWNRSKLGPAAFEREREKHMSTIAVWVTSVLCEMSSVPLLFGHVGNLLLTSRLGDVNSHMMPAQCCVDVDMEGSVAQTLHSIQKARHLQHTNIINPYILQIAVLEMYFLMWYSTYTVLINKPSHKHNCT